MTFGFHPEAEIEFIKAIDFYENQQSELGLEFSVEITKTIRRITTHPVAWPTVSRNIRRALVEKFPFGVLYYYNIEQDYILIVAVMHLHREPKYWKSRL